MRNPMSVSQRYLAVVLIVCTWARGEGARAATTDADMDKSIRIRSFLPQKPISRARRPAPIEAVIENVGNAGETI